MSIMKTSEKNLAFGVIVGNRDVFPDPLAKEGRVEIISVLKDLGYSYVILNESETKGGVVCELAGLTFDHLRYIKITFILTWDHTYPMFKN